MPSRLTVHVTSELIEKAIRRDSRTCMISEAIKVANPGITRVSTDLARIAWSDPSLKRRYVCLTPEVAAQALVDFDQGRSVEPFTFKLRPVQTLRMASRNPDGSRMGPGPKQMGADGVIEGGEPVPTGILSDPLSRVGLKHQEKKANMSGSEGGKPATNRSATKGYRRQYGRRRLVA